MKLEKLNNWDKFFGEKSQKWPEMPGYWIIYVKRQNTRNRCK